MNTTAVKFGHPETLLWETAHWLVLLRPAQVTLGSLVLLCKEPATRFGEIGADASRELHVAADRIERVLAESFEHDKINYLMLMMIDPDVHFHILPRYATERLYEGVRFRDEAWPGPPVITSAADVPDAVFEALRSDLAGRFRD